MITIHLAFAIVNGEDDVDDYLVCADLELSCELRLRLHSCTRIRRSFPGRSAGNTPYLPTVSHHLLRDRPVTPYAECAGYSLEAHS